MLVCAVIEGSIAQAVPEHPKRELIFALSTAFGDAYLFQVSVNWAVAASDVTVHLMWVVVLTVQIIMFSGKFYIYLKITTGR